MKRAVFLDRDGVLNRNVWNPSSGMYESPLTPEQFVLLPGAIASLRILRASGYRLFLVSNQPNYAKGKARLDVLEAIHHKFEAILREEEIAFEAFYYCFHHPEFTGPCACRKPSPYFLWKAAEAFEISLEHSWMIGDRPSDVSCGHAAGARTIWIRNDLVPEVKADYAAEDLWAAAQLILAGD